MASHWHLAIECSATGGSVALFIGDALSGGFLHSQLILPENPGSVQTLAPTIEQLLRNAQIKASSVQSVSVTSGPGSFTGLRVGLATAKMLAWVNSIPVTPVDTLQAIARRFMQNCPQPTGYRLVTAINAYRRQVFTASWSVVDGHLTNLQPSCVMDAATWQADPWSGGADTNASTGPLWIAGQALAIYPVQAAGVDLAPRELWQPLAEDVGCIGLEQLRAGQFVSAVDLMPNYIRASAAEENAKHS